MSSRYRKRFTRASWGGNSSNTSKVTLDFSRLNVLGDIMRNFDAQTLPSVADLEALGVALQEEEAEAEEEAVKTAIRKTALETARANRNNTTKTSKKRARYTAEEWETNYEDGATHLRSAYEEEYGENGPGIRSGIGAVGGEGVGGPHSRFTTLPKQYANYQQHEIERGANKKHPSLPQGVIAGMAIQMQLPPQMYNDHQLMLLQQHQQFHQQVYGGARAILPHPPLEACYQLKTLTLNAESAMSFLDAITSHYGEDTPKIIRVFGEALEHFKAKRIDHPSLQNIVKGLFRDNPSLYDKFSEVTSPIVDRQVLEMIATENARREKFQQLMSTMPRNTQLDSQVAQELLHENNIAKLFLIKARSLLGENYPQFLDALLEIRSLRKNKSPDLLHRLDALRETVPPSLQTSFEAIFPVQQATPSMPLNDVEPDVTPQQQLQTQPEQLQPQQQPEQQPQQHQPEPQPQQQQPSAETFSVRAQAFAQQGEEPPVLEASSTSSAV